MFLLLLKSSEVLSEMLLQLESLWLQFIHKHINIQIYTIYNQICPATYNLIYQTFIWGIVAYIYEPEYVLLP